LRVEYALELLLSEQGFEKTFEVLSQESGFRSYSAFIRCFKQFTGKLPKEFVKDSKS
jgi:AraC-like DNA-binding protein